MAINRRHFLQTGAASCFAAALPFHSLAQTDEVSGSEGVFRFVGTNFIFEWSADNDRFRILNREQQLITAGPLQPALTVQTSGQTARRATPGKLEGRRTDGNRTTWTYADVNGSGRLTVAWRFEQDALWMEPVGYESAASEDIVSLNLFAVANSDRAEPGLDVDDLVLPGVCESEAVSPIMDSEVGINLRTSLGRAGNGVTQQWALPCHYFAGFRSISGGEPYQSPESQSAQAFCCGLRDLPNSDLFVEQQHGRGSLVFDYRGDLWGHLRGPGKFTLGAGLLWVFAPDYCEAIRRYYAGLLAAGVIRKKVSSARKNATLLSPQWCTWGQQMAMKKEGRRLDQSSLEKCYGDFKASGLKASLISIDDGWEGEYGSLQHSAKRFPRFEQLLDRVRADGFRIGMWAAFMRCENPSSLGLTPEQMLRRADGKPYYIKDGDVGWYILDFTRPEVEKVIRERARQYIRRYRPDLVKFDFGYEIPVLDSVAPFDMHWAGERMLGKGLEVVVTAMREENPDIVVMYYQLSPLFTDYLDLHSPDDLGMIKGEYELEANRRFFFCSLCAEFGMPTYGSSGYNWASAPEIWFDSVAIGTVGSLVAFGPSDDAGGKLTPEILARFNGLTHLVRPAIHFSVQPLDPVFSSATRGAHASSWVRLEDGEAVLVALRIQRLDGGPGTIEYAGMVHATASVVIASRTKDALERTLRLGVVPYGEGQLTLRRSTHSSDAEIIEYYADSQSLATRVSIKDGSLQIPLRTQGDNGQLVEWIGVEISGA